MILIGVVGFILIDYKADQADYNAEPA